MATRVFLPLILVVGALFAIGIVYPTLNGPFTVQCGDIDPETCEQIWRDVAVHEEGPTSLLPVTRVRATVTGIPDTADWCGTVRIERWIFSTEATNDCL